MHSHDNSYKPCPLCSRPMTDALSIFLSGGPVSVGVLRTIVNCASTSEDWLSLCRPEVIPTCVRLLKQYSRESSILEGEKGIVCIQLISLGFQVALQTFQDDPFSFTTLSPMDPSLKLIDHVLSILAPRVQQSEELVHRTGIPQRMIMPWLGSDDAGVLLDLLYKERFRFLLDRFTHPSRWEGFSVLLYGIWAHMRGLGSDLNPGIHGPKLLDLACRFVSVASRNPDEDLLATTAIYTMRNISAMFGAVELFPKLTDIPNPGVDVVSDSMTAVRCYIKRLSNGPPHLKLWFHLYEWAHGLVHPDIPELMLPFFQVSYSGIWSLLDPTKEPNPMTPDRACDLVDFSGQLTMFTGLILDEPILNRKNKTALLEVVRQSDIFPLLTRIVLLPQTLSETKLTQKDRKNFSELYDGLRHQIPEFGNTIRDNCNASARLLKKSFPDWLKAFYHLQELSFMSEGSSFVHDHLTRSVRIWIALGSSIFGAKPRTEATRCIYSRCPYPAVVSGMEFECVVCSPSADNRCGCNRVYWARHAYCDSRMRRSQAGISS